MSAVAALRAALDRYAPRPGFTRAVTDTLVGEASVSSWDAGDLVSPGDGQYVLGFVVTGVVKTVCDTPEVRVTIQFVPPGRFFRLAWPFEPLRTRYLQGVAHVPSLVAMVRAEVVTRVVAGLPSLQLSRMMAYSWRGLSSHLLARARLRTMPLRERILYGLQLLARDFGREHDGDVLVDLPLTHADLSEFVVGSRAKVTQHLKALRRADRIDALNGRFLLRRPAASPPDERGMHV